MDANRPTRADRPPLPPRLGSGSNSRIPSRSAPRRQTGRRDSAETTGRAGQARQILSPVPVTMGHNGLTPPPLPPRGSSPSVFSGREGSTFSRRNGTITSPPPEDLELFAHHCRLFFFSATPPETSQAYITATLAKMPPAHRAAYTRVQSQLRSEAHLHHLRVRISSFHALLSSTLSNGSLSLPARSELGSPRARSERAERLDHFIRTWGTSSTGPQLPFFRGLWGALCVQSRGPKRGGAGVRRVVWEIDDAVFLESGGPEFMAEAVAVLKGVLGFEDQPLSTPPKLRRASPSPNSPEDDPDSRARSGSDPFTDRRTPGGTPPLPQPRKSSGRGPAPPPPMSRRKASPNLDEAQWHDNGAPLSPLSPDSPGDREALLSGVPRSPLSLAPMTAHDRDSIDSRSFDLGEEEAELNRPRFRLWTFPAHIADDEAVALMRLFPRFVGRGVDPRLRASTPAPRDKDLELGLVSGVAGDVWSTLSADGVEVRLPRPEREDEAGVVRCGTGRMWAGGADRRAGWEGSAWFRFKRWWRRLFGLT
ncbi:hypothetical protein CcaverHIS002_0206620 [Cutaneotrichosporon cavernicola]|uniref:Uncharacterized protein n=1 Tax=Cutaneotrichosporon cavernicola TaxID=279322 RepID=A0AA48III5_9TREE|nr:uncharacterized protein CcaverHIS019_0206600 [Cutaneotrichosporon cavernicola]BEI81502.1 hypothetical protein CcaverHIS002_0206620 [Cutaneotrichosporon cavernicola]BEI89298.1 hypothetical protein CcaverHIS019_0206600 [Cutaneotrichosporon cavernicola]BEI97074.1 hypothetical protein CcaverHIS631_0206630 [Cutaneotrichosporon cavernicola]BEJ04847.1 hypothetical protein CcaverHIS641_0206640 [Cutaneotrichosporon cavernicola]